MIELNAFYYFVQVVDRKGYSATARALGVPKSSLSRAIGELEAALGVRLIQRTSRSFEVTDVGREIYLRAQSMLAEVEAAELIAKQRISEPAGTIRFSCATALAEFVMAERLPRFMAAFPRIDMVVHASDRRVDLVQGRFDVAVRAHIDPLPDSSLVQRPLATVHWALFASPAYLERAGTPTNPDELRGHARLAHGRVAPDREVVWTLEHPSLGEARQVFLPRLHSDSVATLKRSAEAGMGVVALPGYFCRAELARRTLLRVLPEWTAGTATLTLLMPPRRSDLAFVRAFADFLIAELPAAVAL
ncbi:LysR substrate-binding domain-containing protein [Pendulispora rubella]|uniref:LysR substrate-binding domain-containing protein n=1 Tax=Pendulispora rubella TaxID=2741070 RepID=A0ABZ2KPR1_9BACT